uniref:Uncharacterized protein n=1 Tax=Euplotes harpa TaxID=151035 RepID=A0A7S3J5Y5_9SPIT|mmetsp:Transcript_21810/g.25086  ORF Transcript_21810/g.25086 Transcript_21810/m.25086 type:complete len:131 (+) Transcript_21810:24-416(+)
MDNCTSPTSTRTQNNRSRFYSHPTDYDQKLVMQAMTKPEPTKCSIIEEEKISDRKLKSAKNVCSDPNQLLEGISDMFINSELGVNYVSKNKVDWNVLSNSILNKFAPTHNIFHQQLEKMKSTQLDYLHEK